MNVNIEVDCAGFGENATDTPLGGVSIVSVTAPVNPPVGATAIVEGPFVPWTTLTVVGLADRVKSGVAVVAQPGSVNDATRVLQLKVPVVFRYWFVY